MSKVTITYKTEATVDLDLNKVRDYLLSKGWVDDAPYGEYAHYYFNPELVDSGILVPVTDKISDFNARMNELILDIANAQKTSVPALLEDLK